MRHDGPLPGGTYGYDRECGAMLMRGESDFRPVTRASWDPASRIADLDAAGIDHQIISATPILFQWSRPPRVGADVCAWLNDAALEMCASPDASGRLSAMCQVPLQDVDMACREVERAMDKGHVGVHIGNHVGDRDLDDPGLIAFLSHCASIDAPVLVHPWDMCNPDGRLTKYMMQWTVGMPLETHLSVTAMLLGGAFDRLPRSLKLCFAHGAGAFPHLLGRLENAWHEREVARGVSEHPPSYYMDRFYVDSAVFDPRALRTLVDTMGSDRVMLGSDYPFPLGEQKIGALVRSQKGLSSGDKDAVLGGNAASFFSKLKAALSTSNGASHHARPAANRTPDVINFVSGEKCAASSGSSMPLFDQTNGAERGRVADSSADDMIAAVNAAEAAAPGWRDTSVSERAAVLARAAQALEAQMDDFAAAESQDTGKPLALARGVDVPRAIANLKFFADYAQHADMDAFRMGGHGGVGAAAQAALNYTLRKPVGTVGLITPWNLPLYLLTWKLAPALMMGNTAVAKPSELTPTTAAMLAQVLTDAGLPDGVFNVVNGSGREAGRALCLDERVGAVSFTGGTATGRAVAASVAPRFAKLSLEMGGKNALIAFSDCDFDLTVAGAVRASYLNTGQVCLCPERILVQRTSDGFEKRFKEAFVAAANELKVGSPLDAETDVGPLISAAQKQKAAEYTALAESEGGRVLCGGSGDPRLKNVNPNGYWWAPTAIDGCDAGARAACEEVFGPFVTFHEFDTEEEAIALANATDYGLAASVWSEDIARAHAVAGQVDAGTVWVNCWLHRELHMPFGGVKNSGVSREGGSHSLDFYSEASTVCVKLGDRTPPPMPGAAARRARAGAAVRGRRNFSSSSRRDGFVSDAPKPMGAYTHSRRAGDLLFLAGIGPREPETDSVPGGPIEDEAGARREYDIAAQSKQCFKNVEGVLAASGLTLEDVVDVQVYLVDMKRDFAAFNAEYAAVFGALPNPPTRTTVEIPQLPPGGRIGVELKVVAQFKEN